MHCERGDPWEFLSPTPVVVWLASTSESRENERDFAFHHCCLTGWAPLWPKYLEDCRPLMLLFSVPWWFYVQDIQCEFWWWWTFQAPPWGRPWRSWRGRWASWRGTSSPRSSSLGRYSNNQNGNLRWFSPWSAGSRVPHTYSKKWFLWKPFRIIPWLWKRVLHLVWALYYVYIVVEVTLNMAK